MTAPNAFKEDTLAIDDWFSSAVRLASAELDHDQHALTERIDSLLNDLRRRYAEVKERHFPR